MGTDSALFYLLLPFCLLAVLHLFTVLHLLAVRVLAVRDQQDIKILGIESTWIWLYDLLKYMLKLAQNKLATGLEN